MRVPIGPTPSARCPHLCGSTHRLSRPRCWDPRSSTRPPLAIGDSRVPRAFHSLDYSARPDRLSGEPWHISFSSRSARGGCRAAPNACKVAPVAGCRLPAASRQPPAASRITPPRTLPRLSKLQRPWPGPAERVHTRVRDSSSTVHHSSLAAQWPGTTHHSRLAIHHSARTISHRPTTHYCLALSLWMGHYKYVLFHCQ